MNERIKELAEQALESVSNKRMLKDCLLDRVWDPHEYDQVFAELIVKECIDQVKVFNVRMDARPRDIVEAIQQHFGVGE